MNDIQKELKANRFFLTVSQIGEGENKEEPFDLELIKKRIVVKYKDNIVYCCIGRERHTVKGWHTHIYLHLERRIRYQVNKTFNFLCDKETNVKVVGRTNKDRQKVLGYTRKAGDYIEFGNNDIDLSQQKIGNIKAYVKKMIWEGTTLNRLLNHEVLVIRDYVLEHASHIKRMVFELDQLKKANELEKMKGIKYIDKNLMAEVLTKGERDSIKKDKGLQKIIEHINVVSKSKWHRNHKSKNLLIWSRKPGLGKTSIFLKLGQYCPMYGFPRDKWFDGYSNDTFWMIFWNEMTLAGQLDVDTLKNFLEGIPTQLEIKGSKIEKKDNPQIFMTANRDLKKMVESKFGYEDLEDQKVILESLRERIEEVNVDQYENIFFLSKLIIPIE